MENNAYHTKSKDHFRNRLRVATCLLWWFLLSCFHRRNWKFVNLKSTEKFVISPLSNLHPKQSFVYIFLVHFGRLMDATDNHLIWWFDPNKFLKQLCDVIRKHSLAEILPNNGIHKHKDIIHIYQQITKAWQYSKFVCWTSDAIDNKLKY